MNSMNHFCKKTLLFYYILAFTCGFVQAQESNKAIAIPEKENLVKNGSFEELNDCPDDFGKLEQAIGWTSVNYTPDIFNKCAKNPKVQVPSNFYGTQTAASGKGYAGILTYHETSPIEIIKTTLSEPLEKGRKYNISFKLSLADAYSNFASNNIGVLFANEENVSQILKEGRADIKAVDIVKNTKGWTTISKVFMAEDEYQVMLIGNFYKKEDTKIQKIQTSAYPVAYYYIDDVEVTKIIESNDDENFVKVIGRLYDAKTKQLIQAQGRIDFVLPDINYRAFEVTKEASRYEFSNMQRAKRFYLEAKAKGYFSERVMVEGNDSASLFTQDFYLKPSSLGSSVVLDNIRFDFNKASIHPESFPELNMLITFMQEHRNYHIEIAGHTDNAGIEEHNQKLSEMRAQSIVNYLAEHGFVNRKRMTHVGYGSTQPIASNDTDEGKSKNRRVEMKIVKD